jgi:hypothetical protein
MDGSGFRAILVVMAALSGCNLERMSAHGSSGAKNEMVLETPLARQSDESMLPRDALQCGRWDYDGEKLAVDFGRMREVNSADWGRLCYTYACSYTANVTYEKKPYRVWVNAGGWVVLSSLDGRESRFFVSDVSSESFVGSCNCCEV